MKFQKHGKILSLILKEGLKIRNKIRYEQLSIVMTLIKQ